MSEDDFARETAEMRRKSARSMNDAQWWSALANFREMYADGAAFNALPMPPDKNGNRPRFALMLPRQATPEQWSATREFIDKYLDLYEQVAEEEPEPDLPTVQCLWPTDTDIKNGNDSDEPQDIQAPDTP